MRAGSSPGVLWVESRREKPRKLQKPAGFRIANNCILTMKIIQAVISNAYLDSEYRSYTSYGRYPCYPFLGILAEAGGEATPETG